MKRPLIVQYLPVGTFSFSDVDETGKRKGPAFGPFSKERPAFTFSIGIRFSCRRDRETSTSSISSHSALCFLRSITAAVLRPFASVMN
jgi:hypothetical protein